jgi:hypothetical protein
MAEINQFLKLFLIHRRDGWPTLWCNDQFILETETSASIMAGTNLSVTTMGAIFGTINHYRQCLPIKLTNQA